MKRSIVYIILIFLLMILGFLSFIFIKNLRNGDISLNPNGSSKDYVQLFTQMGENMYADVYYDNYSNSYTKEELNEFLSKFSDIGLQFNLVEIEKYSDEYRKAIDQFVKENKKCKKEDIIVYIYPKNPYSKNDFKSELKINCDYGK